MNESNLINWPEAFSADDSAAWRELPYEKRMEMIAFHAKLNLEILNESEG